MLGSSPMGGLGEAPWQRALLEGTDVELRQELCEGSSRDGRAALWGSSNEGYTGHLHGALLYKDQTASPH